MNKTPKQHARQVATPSPTPSDLLSTLLLVKDTVNTTLLNEHTRCAELSNLVSDVEDQLRDALEQTIKCLKTEIEKRKRKIYPGIKKLQDCLKSLSKSEGRCKASEKGCKNADSKKAKRRIKEAQKILQDFSSSDVELGVASLVSEQINILCQRLVTISPNITFSKDVHPAEKSDTDSEGGFASRTNTPTNNIYAEIDLNYTRDSSYVTPRYSICVSPSERKRTSNITSPSHDPTRSSPVQRLNGVVLFSSDSESEQNPKKTSFYNDTEKTGSHRSRKDRSEHQAKHTYWSPDYEIINKPSKDHVFRSSRERNQLRSPSPILYDYETPVNSKQASLRAPINEYLKRMSPSEHSRTELAPKEETYTRVMKSDDFSTPTSRGTPKRLLPAVPKPADKGIQDVEHGKRYLTNENAHDDTDAVDVVSLIDTVDSLTLSTTCNTIELLAVADEFLTFSPTNGTENGSPNIESVPQQINSTEKNTENSRRNIATKNKPDYVAIEEVEFRQSVSSAKQQILDKLKSKCSYGTRKTLESLESNTEHRIGPLPTLDSPKCSRSVSESKKWEGCENSEVSNINDSNGQQQWSASSVEKRWTDRSGQTSVRNITQQAVNEPEIKKNTEGVFKSRLIHIPDSQIKYHHIKREGNGKKDHESIVSSTIQKFENATKSHLKYPSKTRRPKHRSSSEPRKPVSTLKETTSIRTLTNFRRPDISKSYLVKSNTYNAALQPRNYQNRADSSQKVNEIASLNNSMNGSLNLNKSCTESDLLNLVSNESASSIRRQWSRRRSTSMTSRVTEPKVKIEPKYQYFTSFQIPEQPARSYISAIAALDDGSIVALDELHYLLFLFDKAFKQRDQYRILDVPRNCVKLKANEVAVALPYKKCINTYSIEIAAILSSNEILVPCSQWIVDIAVHKEMYYALCKGGDLHVLSTDGNEVQRSDLGLSGKLFIHPTGKRLFVIAENRLSRFDISGMLLSTKPDVDAYSMIILDNRIYVADRTKHKLLPLTDSGDVISLTDERIEFPSAICSSIRGDLLFVSQYEESMDTTLTRTIHVLKLRSS